MQATNPVTTQFWDRVAICTNLTLCETVPPHMFQQQIVRFYLPDLYFSQA